MNIRDLLCLSPLELFLKLPTLAISFNFSTFFQNLLFQVLCDPLTLISKLIKIKFRCLWTMKTSQFYELIILVIEIYFIFLEHISRMKIIEWGKRKMIS